MVAGIVVLLIAGLLGGCAPAVGPGGVLEPFAVGADQHMTIEWKAAPRGPGTDVWGYVVNHSPYTFNHVRVLVDALGPDGQVIGQRVVWAPGILGSWGRNYFEASIEAAHGYRVRVYSYQRVERDGFGRWPF